MQDFKKLIIWQKSHLLAMAVYKETSKFPKEEVYGISSQIRRACISISSNIAEGCGRNSRSELSRFLQISLGSAKESEYPLLLSHDLNYLNDENYNHLNEQVSEVRKMLIAFINKLKFSKDDLHIAIPENLIGNLVK